MSARRKPESRCERCLMRRESCLCAEIPTLILRTRLLLIMHHREEDSPSNTGRLAAQCLENSVVLIRGDQERSGSAGPHLQSGGQAIVLYPAPEAIPLSPELVASWGGPITLVVPDGSWRQASKMRRRDPALMALPIVGLPLGGGPSRYRVRKDTKEGGLATIEAIARAFGVLEGPHIQLAMEVVFEKMMARAMTARGQRNEIL